MKNYIFRRYNWMARIKHIVNKWILWSKRKKQKKKKKKKPIKKKKSGITHFQLVNFCGFKRYVQTNVDALPGKKEKEGGEQSKPRDGDDDDEEDEWINKFKWERTCNWSLNNGWGPNKKTNVFRFWKKRNGEVGSEWWIENKVVVDCGEWKMV